MNAFKITGLVLWIAALSLTACDSFQKTIDVDLPDYESETVVECYLRPGKAITVLVTQSSAYFGGIGIPLKPDAEVTINSYSRERSFSSRLYYRSDAPFIPGEYFNYQSDESVYHSDRARYTLTVKDKKTGKVITGTTEYLPAPYIEAIEPRFRESDTTAFLLTKFQDIDPDKRNYYRILVKKKLEDGKDKLVNDIKFEGNLKTGNEIAIGSSYDFKDGDQATVTLYHLSKPYYDFLRTMDAAQQGNVNPFAQPTTVKSTVEGGLGVFTFLAFDERKFDVKFKK
ncbi:hypothetical protein BKI52_14885 [marine bacterium AO1-C]|nr:hypothetical protein BKI52_14885 [marine bacterium AO1-C]